MEKRSTYKDKVNNNTNSLVDTKNTKKYNSKKNVSLVAISARQVKCEKNSKLKKKEGIKV